MTDCNCTNFPASLGNVTFGASVGIGTSSPQGPLDVTGYSYFGDLRLNGTDTAYNTILQNNAGVPLGIAASGGDITFGQSLSPTVYIKPSGNVGLGTANPIAHLDVQGGNVHMSGTLQVDGPIYAVAAPGQGDAFFIGNDTKLVDINVANTAGLFGQEDSTVGSVKLGSTGGILSGANGNIGIGTASPQQALDVAGTMRTTGILLGGDQLMSGALKDSTGNVTIADAGGCYYAD